VKPEPLHRSARRGPPSYLLHNHTLGQSLAVHVSFAVLLCQHEEHYTPDPTMSNPATTDIEGVAGELRAGEVQTARKAEGGRNWAPVVLSGEDRWGE
jgi:hypothetical protein